MKEGKEIDTENNRISCYVSHLSYYRILGSGGINISEIKIYPQPYNPGEGSLKIKGLRKGTILKLYSIDGEVIIEKIADENGEIEWDGRLGNGEEIGEGIYIYLLKSPDNEKITGKIGVVK